MKIEWSVIPQRIWYICLLIITKQKCEMMMHALDSMEQKTIKLFIWLIGKAQMCFYFWHIFLGHVLFKLGCSVIHFAKENVIPSMKFILNCQKIYLLVYLDFMLSLDVIEHHRPLDMKIKLVGRFWLKHKFVINFWYKPSRYLSGWKVHMSATWSFWYVSS